ncbi:MAG: hypothetical protein U9Q83_04900 [Bacteroidota bacterium]|nr:hypothetical protein [Bacteroidota bacterium]
MKKIIFTLVAFSCMLLVHSKAISQVLHTENFNVIIDTTKVFKGNFTPSFRYRNVKEDFLEIENTADVSLRIKNYGFTIANKIEYSIFGGEKIMSGGFLYLEYVNLRSKKNAIEPFFQMHWSEIKGLDRKYAIGVNFRWRALVKNNTGLFFGVGGLYEYERWNYSGVPDNLLPTDLSAIEVNRLRANSYVSFKQGFGDLFDLDISGYYQPNLSNFFKNHRLASSF